MGDADGDPGTIIGRRGDPAVDFGQCSGTQRYGAHFLAFVYRIIAGVVVEVLPFRCVMGSLTPVIAVGG
jgi:hypothetical protein